jgi:nitroreductase
MSELEALKRVPASTGINDVIAKRWSPRAFSSQTVAPEDLTKIFTAAGWAASSSNEQPWRFLVGRKGDATYDAIFGALVEFNQMWAGSAPLLILSAAKRTFTANGEANEFALHDTGAASATLALEATALGLHVHGMGGFDRDKAREDLNVPEDYVIGACWALGYLGDPQTLHERMRVQELKPRERKPLSAFVFKAWNEAAEF